MKKWFNFVAKEKVLEIDILDEIGGWGISAAEFKKMLDVKDNGQDIKVNINSPGGSVFDGITIYSLLAERRDRVSVEVYGVAASIASVIALAGKELVMREGSFFMIHDPWSITLGDSTDHRKTADILDKIANQIMGIYSSHTMLTDEELKDAMKEETWYTPEQAVDVGFAARVEGQKIAASINFEFNKHFKNAPRMESEKITQVVNLEKQEVIMADDKTVQAVQPEKDVKLEMLTERMEASIKEIEDLKAKLETVTVRPNISPSFEDEGAQWFYDSLKKAGQKRGDFKAAADTITTTDGMGIPVAASEKIMMNVNQMSIMRKYGADVRPAGAQQTRFSTVVDSGMAGLIAEGGSYAEKADPTLITLDLYKLGGRFSLTEETNEDSFMAMYDAFSKYAARIIARAENAYFLSGTGAGQPKGVDEETAALTAAASGAVTFAELLSLDESLDPEWDFSLGEGANYKGPVYLMSTSTAAAIRALVDANSNYYFRDNEDGRLNRMFGRPVVRTNNIADFAVNAISIVLVNPMAYLIGERKPSLAIKVGYDNDTHNITWDFSERVGGQTWDPNGVAPLKMAAV